MMVSTQTAQSDNTHMVCC